MPIIGVTHVSEQVLTMSPVYTKGGLGGISSVTRVPRKRKSEPDRRAPQRSENDAVSPRHPVPDLVAYRLAISHPRARRATDSAVRRSADSGTSSR